MATREGEWLILAVTLQQWREVELLQSLRLHLPVTLKGLVWNHCLWLLLGGALGPTGPTGPKRSNSNTQWVNIWNWEQLWGQHWCWLKWSSSRWKSEASSSWLWLLLFKKFHLLVFDILNVMKQWHHCVSRLCEHIGSYSKRWTTFHL